MNVRWWCAMFVLAVWSADNRNVQELAEELKVFRLPWNDTLTVAFFNVLDKHLRSLNTGR